MGKQRGTSPRCSGCAFTPATEANRSTLTLMQAKLCAAAAHPFYCHENLDASGAPFAGEEMELCTGFVESMARLDERGHFASQTPEQRRDLLHRLRIVQLADECHGGTDREAEAGRLLRRIFSARTAEAREQAVAALEAFGEACLEVGHG